MDNSTPDPPHDTALDPAILEEVFSRIRPRLKQILAYQHIPADEAEDLLQEALLAALYKWSTIRDLEFWLMGALRNRCLLYWRSQRMKLFQAVDPESLEHIGDPQPAAQERQEMFLDLEKVAAGFSPYHRKILQLRFGMGLSVAEVAELVGSNTENIRKLSNRVIARIRRRILESGTAESSTTAPPKKKTDPGD
jgi:RNA polymerase sigma factor (sigma-70 family)